LQDPPKFSQSWIFGLKTNHLATLLEPFLFKFYSPVFGFSDFFHGIFIGNYAENFSCKSKYLLPRPFFKMGSCAYVHEIYIEAKGLNIQSSKVSAQTPFKN
jgi:hypothetical protein